MSRDDVIARLLNALNTGDDLALAAVFKNSVRMVLDTGDETGGVIHGRSLCAARLQSFRHAYDGAFFVEVSVNGAPGLALRLCDGWDVGVLTAGYSLTGQIDRLWLSAAPRKLLPWNRQRFPEL
ncbi:hypothetical protein L1277_002687 [Okibacterium sp. HSC-33S16]|uniref:hypothetical protein n=1 Tax=Okibacterium sp. HSC-33S16 TaxID=2910965 RepID=UPI00209F3756|nr:hypothetical protein [Okibacterium sp. HSC-33S16]MCP2032577.1 hypothetical protein [Okibacterium sp. HSC-33S16]